MSDDLIRRSDAIKAIINKPAWHGSDGAYYHGDDIRDALNGLPSADRPQGEWIKDEDGTYRCSNCGGCEEQYIYGTENWYGCGESKFCPSCGARMKGADDEDV